MSIPLTIELVPRPLWRKSLKQLLPRQRWDALRRQVYRQYHHQCQACGATDTIMYCHEIWAYDDDQHVQRPEDLSALCELCHHCTHLGYAEKEARAGKLDMEALIRHLCRVTGFSPEDFDVLREAAFEQWAYRSEFTWTQDFGAWAGLLGPGEQ